MILLLLACAGVPDPPLPLPPGAWTLEGEGVVGELTVEDGACRVGLWGPTFRAGAGESVPCGLEDDPGGVWVHLPLEMGAGIGMAVMQVSEDGARLPLGERAGEWEVLLKMRVGPLSGAQRTEAIARSAAGLAREASAWEDGRFRLEEGGQLVGHLQFAAEPVPLVEVFDAFWATLGLVAADVQDAGPDLLLEFDVSPSFQGEGGVLRVNRPVREARVPLAEEAHPADRLLSLVPGGVTDEERQVALAGAQEAAGKRELEVMLPLASQLLEAASAQACEWDAPLRQQVDLLLVGYAVRLVVPTTGACGLTLEPSPVQHGRRLAATLKSGVPPRWVLRDLSGSTEKRP